MVHTHTQVHVINVTSYYTVPSVPTNLTAKALSHDQMKITWGPVADNGGADVNSFVLKVAEVDWLVVIDNFQEI